MRLASARFVAYFYPLRVLLSLYGTTLLMQSSTTIASFVPSHSFAKFRQLLSCPRPSSGLMWKRKSSYKNERENPQVNGIRDEATENGNAQEDQTLSPPLVVTPCVRICRYNADFYDGQVCIGCFREAFEIGCWSSFTDTEKLFAYQDALDRCGCAEDGQLFPGSISCVELERQKNLLEQQSSFW